MLEIEEVKQIGLDELAKAVAEIQEEEMIDTSFETTDIWQVAIDKDWYAELISMQTRVEILEELVKNIEKSGLTLMETSTIKAILGMNAFEPADKTTIGSKSVFEDDGK